MTSGQELLSKIIEQGDLVEVANGALRIIPLSDKPVPKKWLKEHSEEIMVEMLKLTGQRAFFFRSHKTGNYCVKRGGHIRSDAVTMMFECPASDEVFYAIFNVSLKRKRTTLHGKAGDPLPSGVFHPTPKSNFIKMWRRTGLPLPTRLSSISDYMGNLKPLAFTFQWKEQDKKDGKIDTATIEPISISYTQIFKAYRESKITVKFDKSSVVVTDNSRTTHGQLTDNCQTTVTDKEMPQGSKTLGLQQDSTTGKNTTVIRQIGNTVTREIPTDPSLQTIDEWSLGLYD